MMLPLSLGNVAAYCVQVAVLTAVGTALVTIARLRMPVARLACWRALLLACVVLPLVQPWVELRLVPSDVSVAAIAGPTLAETTASGEGGWLWAIGWTRGVVAVWLAGAAFWLVRLMLGLFRLRAMRRAGEPADLAPGVAEVSELLGASADVRWLPDLPQPVTFGVRRPVVLLPGVLGAMSLDVQRAVVAHELIHVIRRDWAWVIAEELVRAGLWFHPAIWWLLAQMQLAREQVVDAYAVLVLGARRPYMEALLACADRTSFVPVPAFARRRELFQRLTQLSREVEMSRARVLASFVLLALGVFAAGRYAVAAFPLHAQLAPSRTVLSSTADSRALKKIVNVEPQYPPLISLDRIRGVVTLNITVDERGNVIDAKIVSTRMTKDRSAADIGSELTAEVAEAARTAALQWKYEPLGLPIATIVVVAVGNERARAHAEKVVIRPRLESGAAAALPGDIAGEVDSAKPLRVGGAVKQPTKIHDVQPVYPQDAQSARVQGVVIMEVTIGTDGKVTDTQVLKSIPMLDDAAVDAVKQWEFTPTLVNNAPVPVIVTMTVNFTLR